MALVTKNFTLNVTPGAMPPTVHVSEYDVGRTYTIPLVDENGNAFEIPTGTTATVEGTLNGTVGFTTSATISNNQITFALTESMTAYAGKAWCKIKLTLNSEPIQTCAFILAVDRAGVEADTVIGASGFEQQIVDAVQDWLDEHPPASGGMTEEFKQALLDCFENVAWINDDGQTYYDALYAALYPPVGVLSISAVFTQGEAVIYDTDDLDTLKQYLVVTATMTDSTTRTVTDYTLSGTLEVGTSTITVSYGGKTTTFNVTVTEYTTLPSGYTKINGVHGNGSAYVKTNVQVPLGYSVKVKARAYAAPSATANIVGADRINPANSKTTYLAFLSLSTSANWLGAWYGSSDNFFSLSNLYDSAVETTTMINAVGSTFSAENASGSNSATVSFSQQNPSTALHLCLFYNGNTVAGKFTGDILGVEVLDDSNNTSETFIPAKRDSDNVIGFYAVTEGTFYPSDTSTPFTAVV